jgi:hypothetical protein
MLINMLDVFKVSTNEICTTILEGYPDGTLNSVTAIRSINKIEGIISTLKVCLQNKIEEDELEKEEWEKEIVSIDYFSVLNRCVKMLGEVIVFCKKNNCQDQPAALHGVLQKIQGISHVLIVFLDSIKVEI